MKTLDKYEITFGKPKDEWGCNEWKRVAMELAAIADEGIKPKKRGRKPSKDEPGSANQNYLALAFWVKQRMDAAANEGKKISIKEAVRDELLASVNRRNKPQFGESTSTRKGLVDTRYKTAYTEVRKLLAKQEKADKN